MAQKKMRFAVVGVIGLAVLIGGIIPDIVAFDLYYFIVFRSSDDTLGKHRAYHFGEQSHHIKPHQPRQRIRG